MRVTNSRNHRNEKKTDQKTISLGLWSVEIGLKIRDPQKVHLGLLLNVHTKFHFPSPIWRGDKGETALFRGQIEGKSPYLPS